MGIFEDKVYDSMDWLEKACVPIVCELNDILNKLPDEIILNYEMIVKNITSYGLGYIRFEKIVESYIDIDELSYSNRKRITDCFDVHVEGEPIVDLEKGVMFGGVVKIVKIKEAFEEKEIEELIGVEGIQNHLRVIDHKDAPVERINELLELLGLNEARRSRSSRQKIDAIKIEIENIMSVNKWDIRDIALSNRVSLWIKKYLIDGNLAAYMNFCKLKIMTHEEAPIYSIEGEEKV